MFFYLKKTFADLLYFRSFVENHIREVHKGHPVIVTELTIDTDIDAPIGRFIF